MKQKNRFQDLGNSLATWFHTHPRKRWVVIAAGFLVLASIVGGIVWALTPAKSAPVPTVTTPPKPKPTQKYYSPLTGNEVPSKAATTAPVTGIMIENSPEARPQSGLKDAGVIYEAIAEGGITRFLALYQEAKPELIGPVRSLRMYYVDWLAPYNASAAHIGGSAAALAEIRNGSYRDIDQFFNAGSYWRVTDRAAPHNVYTSFERLDALNAAKQYTSSTFQSFARTSTPPAGSAPATSVAVTISGPLYNSAYTYDQASKTYLRSEGGAAHNDREGGQLAPAVVIAMHVDMTRVMEDGYRQSIATTGTGKVEIFQQGTVTEGTWRKNSRNEPLELIDANGKAIELARGQTWITAIPNNSGGVSWH